MHSASQLALWTAGDASYALPLDTLVEVVPVVSAHPIPGAPAWIRGIMNHRGTLIGCIGGRELDLISSWCHGSAALVLQGPKIDPILNHFDFGSWDLTRIWQHRRFVFVSD